MGPRAITIALAIVASFSVGDARAASVAVVDAQGKPIDGAKVACIDPASEVVGGSCRRARCQADGFLPGEVAVTGGTGRCVLRPATIVRCELPAAAGPGLEARLLKFAKEGAAVASVSVPAAAEGATATRFALPPIAPGHYELELARARDGWTCRADLGPLGPGVHPVAPAWRDPAIVGVRVKRADGKPAAGVPVRAWSRRPASDEPGRAAAALGAWSCAPPPGPPQATDATGVVRLSVDLAGQALIVAGDWKDDRGLGYQILERAPTDALTLTLAAPIRVRGKVEDEKDRPVACDASLTDLPSDLSWLAAVVPGAIVKAACDPCSVEVGKTSTVTATVQDSISCSVTYRWTAPSGTLAQPAERSTIWTASQQEGSVPVTVTVTCPSDNKTASDTVNIQVTKPPVRNYVFEDVYFDFDRYSLRPEATRVLDEAIAALRENATLRVEIEGHTCNIGTAEYNLALGDRRANAVKDYLVSRGVTADRLRTVSYGEEKPKYDNSREETRRLNRRAALVVNLR
jgi:peptidoglycan-associated lipoprotein